MGQKASPDEPAKDGARNERPSRRNATSVGKDDKQKAEKLTGEHEVYEPEGGDG